MLPGSLLPFRGLPAFNSAFTHSIGPSSIISHVSPGQFLDCRINFGIPSSYFRNACPLNQPRPIIVLSDFFKLFPLISHEISSLRPNILSNFSCYASPKVQDPPSQCRLFEMPLKSSDISFGAFLRSQNLKFAISINW